MSSRRILHFFPAVLLLVVLLLGSFAARAIAQGALPPVEWTRFDVDLALDVSGILHVTEFQEVAFRGGPFSKGFATIPLSNIEGIDQVRVGEQGADGQITPYRLEDAGATIETAYTYRVQSDTTTVYVDWWFPPTRDASRTFVVQYDVRGAVRHLTERDGPYSEIWWIAIDAEVTETAPIHSATVTLTLPVAIDPADVMLSPEGYVPSTASEGAVWTWTRTDLAPGDRFTVRLRFPTDNLPTPVASPAPGSPVPASGT